MQIEATSQITTPSSISYCFFLLFLYSYCFLFVGIIFLPNDFWEDFKPWLPGEKVEKLGVSQELDEGKLIESRKPTDRQQQAKNLIQNILSLYVRFTIINFIYLFINFTS